MAQAAARAGATHFGSGIPFLKPAAQKMFLPFLVERFPRLARRYRERFEESAYLRGPYQEMVRERAARIRSRHGLSSSPIEYQPEIPSPEEAQLVLFP